MARKKREEESSGGAPEWMTTFSDLVTLLLCFFVLLFAFSAVDAQKFKSVMQSFQGGTGVMPGTGTIQNNGDSTGGGGEDPAVTEEVNLAELKGKVDEYSESKNLSDKLVSQINERGLTIRMLDTAFFESGNAEINDQTRQFLDVVSDMLNRQEFTDKGLKIEGHTDADPIRNNPMYPTNWELSAARATNVLRYLVETKGIDGSRVSSSGYGHFKPIAPNDTPENKAKNRRVDLVILRTTQQKNEPN